MTNEVEVREQADSGEVAPQPIRAVDDIVASRAVVTDRIFKGGTLAVLGFGGALLMDLLNLSPGVPFWIGIVATLTAFGAGAIWAGSGATHLIRHGRKGSSLWLVSLAGLGGSVLMSVGPGGGLGVSGSVRLEPPCSGCLWALHRRTHHPRADCHCTLDASRFGSGGGRCPTRSVRGRMSPIRATRWLCPSPEKGGNGEFL